MAIPELQIGSTLDEFPGGTVNKIIRKVNQLEAQRLPRRGGGGGASVEFVAIVKSPMAKATWVKTGDGKSTDGTVEVHPFSGSEGTITKAGKKDVRNGLSATVTITTGKFRKAIVIGGYLVQVQCEEWDLPENWDS